MPTLVSMLDQEMEDSRIIFNKQQQKIQVQFKPTVDKNMPRMCGQLKWSQELRSKMSFPIKKFKGLSHPVCYGAASKEMFKKYKDMNRLLDEYEHEVYIAWNETITGMWPMQL